MHVIPNLATCVLGSDPSHLRKYGICTMLVILGARLAIVFRSGGDSKGSGCVVRGGKGVRGSKGGKGVIKFWVTCTCELPKIEPKLSCCGL